MTTKWIPYAWAAMVLSCLSPGISAAQERDRETVASESEQRSHRPSSETLQGRGLSPPPAGSAFLTTDRFSLADGRVTEVERGVIYLPESRTTETDRVVAVEFHRFPATNPDAEGAVPIVELYGGPGFGGLSSNLSDEGFYERWIAPFRRHADYIVIGQRGFGVSRPYLRCGEYERPVFDETAPEELRMERAAGAAERCRDFWTEKGVALEGFNVREAAADVADVLRALDYDRVSLFANSFGSHWALAVMRYHPELAARAVLGGLEGPDHTYDMPGHVLDALRRIAADAERSPDLQDRIPEGGLIAALETVIERLRREPVTVQVEDEETGETHSVTVNHYIAQSVAEDGYSEPEEGRHSMSTWPADIIDLYHGDLQALALEALDEPTEGYGYIPSAAYFLYDCASGISHGRTQQLRTDPATSVLGRENWLYEGACPVFGVDLGEDFRTGFRTDVPTVIVQGTWDTSTPIENVRELLPRFTDATFIPVERGTHGSLYLPFRDDPSPDTERLGESLFRFLATGDRTGLPASLSLPPVEWKLPETEGGG